MVNNAQPTGDTEIFEKRFDNLQKLSDEDLGELFSARNQSTNERIWALKFYDWVGDLRSDQQQQLRAVLAAVRQLAHPLLLTVKQFHIEPTKLDAEKQPLAVNYIEFAEPQGRSLAQWSQWQVNNQLREAVAIVITLADGLVSLHQQTAAQSIARLVPVIEPKQIILVGLGDEIRPRIAHLGWSALYLTDIGLIRYLRADPNNTPASPKVEALKRQELALHEVKALGMLLLQLLRKYKEDFAPTLLREEELKQVRDQVSSRYPAVGALLAEFFAKALPPFTPDSYQDPGAVATALRVLYKAGAQLSPQPDEETQPAVIPNQPPTHVATARGNTVPSADQTTTQPLSAQVSGSQPVAPANQPTNQAEVTIALFADQHSTTPLLTKPLGKAQFLTFGDSPEDDFNQPGFRSPRRLMILHQNGEFAERYVVADTGNGPTGPTHVAHLDGLPLSPYFAAILHERSRLEFESYRIQLIRANVIANPLASRRQRPLQVTQTHYAANPGERFQIQVTMQNVTKEVDSFWLAVDGAPSEMQIELPEPKELFADETTNVALQVRLPALNLSQAGEIPLILRLISENYRVQIAAIKVTITVLPHYDYVGMLLPQTLRLGDDGKLLLENQGNLTRIFTIQWHDRAQELDFVPPEATVTVPPLTQTEITYRAYLRKGQLRVLGSKRFHNMDVLIQPQRGGIPQNLPGQVVSRALIPAWAPTLLLVLLLLFLFAANFLFQPEFAHPATVRAASTAELTQLLTSTINTKAAAQVAMTPTPTTPTPVWIAVPTPMADATKVHLLWQPLGSCFYSVYENDVITSGPNFISPFLDKEIAYQIQNQNEGTIVEVRLRSCLLIGERSWKVAVQPLPVTTPTPTDTPVPMVRGTNVAINYPAGLTPAAPQTDAGDGVTRLLIGQLGEFCFQWQSAALTGSLLITPTLPIELSGSAGEQCQPINQLFKKVLPPTDFSLVGMQGEQPILSAPFARIEVRQPICRVNIDESLALYLAIREGPGRNFPERGGIFKDQEVLVLARPFKPIEREEKLDWLLVSIGSDPRPGWVAFREYALDYQTIINTYLACPPDLDLLPNAELIPPTPTPTPTTTPEATVTPTATPASEISLEPPIINPGGCALLQWQIENVKEVYLNGEGVVGEGEREECRTAPGQYLFEWQINKIDGSVVKIQKTLTVNPGPGGLPAEPTPPE